MQNSSARAAIDVGSVIAGTYTIEALIGRGGMGAVFLASHARLPGKKVAIKVLHAEMDGDEILARFKREAQIASMLSHPNIVHIEDYNVTDDGMPYLVLEYLQGESLAQRLKRGPLTVDQTFSIIRQVGSALAVAHHKGIVHRDLKPQNIFLVPSELEGRSIEIAKILDFGISKMRDSQTVKTQDSALLGTPQYMAPEQATGQHASVDERTDVFALGAIIHEMLSGAPAFSGASIPEVVFKVVYEQPAALATLVPSIPAELAAAVHRALSKSAAERFQTVGELVEALTGQPLPPPRSTATNLGLDAGPSTGPRTPITNREAFAQTMGSGGDASAMGMTTPPTQPSVRGSAPTVDSQNAPALPAPANTPPPKSRTGWIVATAIAVAAIVATGIALRAGKRRHKTNATVAQVESARPAGGSVAERPAPHAAEDSAAGASTTDGGATTTTDTNGPTGTDTTGTDTTGTDTTGTNSPADTAAPKKAGATTAGVTKSGGSRALPQDTDPADDDDGGSASAAQKLRDADAAMRAGQWERAEQLTNAVINSEDAAPKQKARAEMLHGMVRCLGRNDEEGALNALRRIKHAPLLRHRLLLVCHKAGYLKAER